MTDIGEVVVRIRVANEGVRNGMNGAVASVQTGTRQMQVALERTRSAFSQLIPFFSIATIASFGKGALSAADRMNDLGERIGFTASTLSALETPLKQRGSDLEQFAAAITLMNNQIGEAARDIDGPVAQAFQRLGLDIQSLRQMTPEQAFYAIADALSLVSNEFDRTEAARNIFGRGVAALLPLIKQANGDLATTVEKLGEVQGALSEEKFKNIDEFGDRMAAAAIRAKNEFLSLVSTVLGALNAIQNTMDAIPNGPYANAKVGTLPKDAEKQDEFEAWKRKSQAMGMATSITYVPGQSGAATQELDKLLTKTKAQAEAVKEVKQSTKALDDQMKEVTVTIQNVGEETQRTAIIIKDYLGDAFESAIFDAENFGDAAKRILDGVARQIARQAFINPLAESLSGAISSSIPRFNFGGFFADGGSPPVGIPSVVGENGPEIFIPRTAGTIVPNHQIGGSSVSVQNVFNIGGGVTRQELASLIPTISAQAQAGVFAAIERGGREARLVGRKS